MAPPLRSSQYVMGEDVLTTVRDEEKGTITAQLGRVARDQASAFNSIVVQHVGFASRPAAAVAGTSAAQAWGIRTGSQNVILGMRDGRTSVMYGALAEGETAVFASEGQARGLFKADGSINLYTTSDNTATGQAIAFTMSPEHGIVMMTPWGGFSIGPNGIVAYTQDGAAFGGSLEITPAGTTTLLGPTCKVATGQCLLGVGATAVKPALYSPVPVVGGVAGGTAVPSLSVFIG